MLLDYLSPYVEVLWRSNIIDEVPRERWTFPTNYAPRKSSFTNGLKMVCGVGAGDFLDTHSIADTYGLSGFASVFQSEALTILETRRRLGHDPSFKLNITIVTNSQATIKAFY